jgi:integrase/recombinase XerD
MTKWPDSDGVVFRRYVQGLGLRTAMAARVYHCILRGFQRFISGYDHARPVSQASLTAWIQDRITVWPLHLVIHRARLVDRFLDWLVSGNRIAENPLAKLRAEYRQHSTAPIVRALADLNPVAALEKLRTLPPFGSHLGPAMRAHISVMRTAGFRYGDYENRLLALDRFLQQQPDAAEQPLAVLVQRWAQQASRLELHLARVRVGRVVARALQREDPSVIMPRLDRQLVREVRRRQRRPHIFSAEEIRKLFQTTLAFPSPRAPLRPRSLHTMLVLAYCAGLRLGEIARLRIGDVRIDQGVIEIRETKFFKTRHLPLSPSALAALQSYMDARKKAGGPSDSNSPLLWHQQARCGYSRITVEGLLARVLRRAGVKPPRPSGRIGPRIHDLRHTFVVHRMTEWYRAGVNPEPMLPYLATYLGHKDIHSTLVYLTITQELLHLANDRFRLLGALLLQPHRKEIRSR